MRESATELSADPMTKRNAMLVLALILVAGALLRYPAVGHGLPYMRYTDDVRKVALAQQMFKTMDLDPNYFNKPTFFLYVNALAYVPYYIGGRAIGAFDARNDILAPRRQLLGTAFAPMPSTIILGRLLSASFGMGTIALLYLAGARLWDNRLAGLVAAGILALSPVHRDLDRIHPDAQVMFFIVLSLIGAIGVVRQGRLRDYLFTGIALGFALSSKYNALLFVPAIVIAHLVSLGGFREGWWKQSRLWWSLAAMGATFVVLNPFLFVHLARFTNVMHAEVLSYTLGHNTLIMEGQSPLWYPGVLLSTDSPILLFGIVAFGVGFIPRDRSSVLVAGYMTPYLVAILIIATRNHRTLAPAVPFLALLGARLALEIVDRIRSVEARGKRGAAVAIGGALCAWFLLQPLVHSLADLGYKLNDPSWKLAAIWVDRNLPEGSHVAVESFSPWVDSERFEVTRTRDLLSRPSRYYRDLGVEYLVLSDSRMRRAARSGGRNTRSESFEAIQREFELLKRFDNGRESQFVFRVPRDETRAPDPQ